MTNLRNNAPDGTKPSRTLEFVKRNILRLDARELENLKEFLHGGN